MNIATDLLDLLQRAAARAPLPRVRALHLPQSASFGTKDGEFCAIELDDGSLGLSYVLLGDTLAALASGAAGDAGGARLVGADALDIARWYASPEPAHKTIGFAAINAITRHVFDRAGYAPSDAADSIGGLDPQPGESIGMIGFFPPLVKQVTARGARLTVLELRGDLAGAHDGFEVTLDPAALASCDKVLSTSTVLLNDTLDAVLAACTRARHRAFAMIGPGAGCAPDALFVRGVTTLGGTWITSREGFLGALASGAPWNAHARKFAIDAGGYPGFDRLLGLRGTGP